MTQDQVPQPPESEDSTPGLHIIDQVEDVLWACDLNLKFTYLSPVTEKNTGYSAEERKRASIEELLTSSSIITLKAIVEKHAAIIKNPADGPDAPARCVVYIYRKDGSTYPAEASISFIRNSNGELTGLAGSNRNITERIRAEAIINAIHEGSIHATGSQYLNDLVRSLSTTLYQRYVFIAQINDGTSQTLAFCKDGKIAANFDYSLLGSPCENVAAGEICYFPKNASKLFPHEVGMQKMGVESYIGSPIPDANGKVQGLLVIMHDEPMKDIPLLQQVLEVCADRVGAEMSRRKIQGLLEESEQRFHALFEQSIDPCFIHNREGVIVDTNRSMELAFGYSKEAFRQLNATLLSSADPAVRVSSRAAFQKVQATGFTRYETLLRRKSGATFPAEVTTQLINIEGQELAQSVIRDLTEQHRLRERTKSAQQTLAKLFSSMHTMIAMLDTQGHVTYANTTAQTNPDAYQVNDFNKKLWDFEAFSHDPKAQALIKGIIATALKGQQSQADVQVASPKGPVWMQLNIHPIRNDNGQVRQLLLESTDIDQRKKMAEQILAEERRRELFREQAPMAVIEWDTDTFQLTEWNAAAEQLFGFNFDEVKGQQPSFLSPKLLDIEVDGIRQALNMNKTNSRVSGKNRTKDGRTIVCEWYNSPITDSNGKLIAAMSIVRDITAEHSAQQMLLIRDAEQREILDTMLDAVFTLDENANIQTFNKAAENLLGYQADDIIGQSCWILLPEQHIEKHRHYMNKYLATGEMKYMGVSADIGGLRSDGSAFPMRMAIAPLGEKNADKQRFIASIQDLTRFKQQEEQLRRSQKMDALGKLTGGIAHDFNNMLGVIMGYADLLQVAIKDQPKLERYADEIYRAGQRGAQLTEKLLGFSRQKTAVAEVLSINTLLQTQQHMLAKAITPRITLVYDLGESLWPVYLDSGDLVDAILNISINAMHAMSEGGKLSLVTHNEHINELDAPLKGLPKGDYVLLSISDTGCGMDKHTQEKIFDPFFSTKGELGTGLGLSQVYGFVERSKGLIKIYSELGHGTRLTLYFPRHRETSGTTDSNDSASAKHSLNGTETILVVDDEEALLNLSTEILHQHGYQVIPVGSGKQALDVLKSTPVQLLLSDVIMPEMDGYQLAATVQAQYPEVKIQLASGFTDDRHSTKLNPTLLDNIIKKPFKIKDLLSNIRELLDS
ncbi:MAG: hypothetical protein DRQ64_02905 [Gammaproteobacteria bacterium]|nr:MAG: hypothetical protein DRQ64_02905 [Gammaproteobacteria bacterium]